jgi:hypothetical protein
MWATSAGSDKIMYVELTTAHTLSIPVTLPFSFDAGVNTYATDVRGFVEGGVLRYLIISYRTFTTGPITFSQARIRVFRSLLSAAPTPVSLASIGMTCPTIVGASTYLFIDGCTACAANNQALCDTCVSDQGKLRPLLTIFNLI